MLRRLWAIIQKEFIQTLRDRSTLGILLAVPLIQLILFAYAIHMNIQHIPMAVADQSLDETSRAYTDAMIHSGYFDLAAALPGQAAVVEAIAAGRVKVGLVIPPDFKTKTERGEGEVLLLVDGSDPFTTQSAYNAASVIASQQSATLLTGRVTQLGSGSAEVAANPLDIYVRILYNPDLKDLWFIIPGMVAMILQTQTIALTALAVVREREAGTIEQILVTPIRPFELMLGKSIPNLVIALLNTLTIVLAGVWIFGVTFAGDPILYGGLAMLYVFSGLGLGLLISSLTQNQRQAQQMTLMVTLVGLILGGFVFPHYAMPAFLKVVSYLFPLTYFIPISRGVFTKGIGMAYLWPQVAGLAVYILIILFLAARLFRQRLD